MRDLPRLLRRAAWGLAGISLVAFAAARMTLRAQGADAGELRHAGLAVEIDDFGVPTIEADAWPEMVEAQGYVTASARLFQMDLMRRAARGRLAELIPAAVALDERRHEQDWEGAATRMADNLPPEEAELCERYAAGVNRFIADHPRSWGVEYVLLGVEPAPWSCRDTLAIALSMAEQLSTDMPLELARGKWKAALPPDWYAFLFPTDHPRNEPLFGTGRPPPPLPAEALPPTPLAPEPATAIAPEVPGSNSWAIRDGSGARLLANDPHLGANVPHLWYFVRLYFGPERWVVGATIPGIPAVVLGMNPHLAWAFTNVGEDVDDVLIERLSPGKDQYLHAVVDGTEQWRPVEVRRHVIHVRGGRDVVVASRHTARGPLLERDGITFSRQWLPLLEAPATAGLWTAKMADARDWDAANRALDAFRLPAQNVTVMDRAGNLGYRATGTGVRRRGCGREPRPAVEGAWTGLEAPRERPRRFWPAARGPVVLATANQRIWVDACGHDWDSDRRAARIREVLAATSAPDVAAMAALQLDTYSRYHQTIARWVAAHATASPDTAALREALATWDGHAFAQEDVTARARAMERDLVALLLGRVKARYLPPRDAELLYPGRMRDVWVRRALADEAALARFGLEPTPLADRLLAVAAAHDGRYIIDNRWQAQHPFVGRVPLLGDLFRVAEYAQWGDSGLVRVERPRFGASFRVVWDLADPSRSRWITPVGQSGHVGSAHFADLQPRFHRDLRLPALDATHDWGLAPGADTASP